MTLQRANHRAQRRFRDMLRAYFRDGTWETPEKVLYLEGDALVTRLEDELAWEDRKADIDRAITADLETEPELRALWGVMPEAEARVMDGNR